MADLGFLLLWYPFPFKVSFQKALSMNLGWVDVDRVAGHQKYILFPRCLETKQKKKGLFISPENILSIVLQTCPGTALAQMNFGWQDFGLLLPHS